MHLGPALDRIAIARTGRHGEELVNGDEFSGPDDAVEVDVPIVDLERPVRRVVEQQLLDDVIRPPERLHASIVEEGGETGEVLDTTDGQRLEVLNLQGLSDERCFRRSSQRFSAAGMRSAKVTAKALSAGFHLMVHRACPVPLGSSPRVTR